MSRLRASLCGFALVCIPTIALAQAWPSQPIKVITPFTAGSASDLIARTVFDQVSQQVGQPVVIDNRGGGGGTIGTNAVAKAPPDGYTLLVHTSTHTVTPATHAQLPYDMKDLKAVIPLANLPNVLVVNKKKGYKSVRDMVDAAKVKSGTFNYGTAGPGTASHFNAERFRLAARFDATHVPFRGGPEALREVAAERVDFYFVPLLPAKGMISEGQLDVLAVSSSQRSPSLPNVPTTIEAGYPNSEFNFWCGVLAPAATPQPVLDRLYKELKAALDNPAVKERLARMAADPMPMTSAEFEALMQKEVKDNIELAKAAGIKVN